MIPGVFASSANSFGWTPAQLSPSIWLDDSSDVTDAGGGACSQWNDKSGNGWHFTQTTSADRPLIIPAELNAARILRFDADNLQSVDARGVFSNAGVGWSFSVYRKRGEDLSGVERYIFEIASGANNLRYGALCGLGSNANQRILAVRRLDGSGIGRVDASSTHSSWEMRLDVMDWAAATGYIYVNGSLDASSTVLTPGTVSDTTSASNSPAMLGAAKFGTGSPVGHADIDVACLIVGVGSAPDEDARAELFNWAASRYGL